MHSVDSLFDQLSRYGWFYHCMSDLSFHSYMTVFVDYLVIPDIYKSIMSIFRHYRENSTDMFPGQIADMIETRNIAKLLN